MLKYRVELDRQLKLTEIRLEGTTQFAIEDIKTVLESQEANLLGIIPLFGYGRGLHERAAARPGRSYDPVTAPRAGLSRRDRSSKSRCVAGR